MVDLEDQLSSWSMKSRAASALGRDLTALAIEVTDAYVEHISASDENVGGHLEGEELWRMAKEAKRIVREAKRVQGQTAFDSTALRQFANDAHALQLYCSWAGNELKHFKVESESKIARAAVNDLVEGLLLPNMPEPAAVSRVNRKMPRPRRNLAHQASINEYHAHGPEKVKERYELLKRYTQWDDISSAHMQEHLFETELRKLRGASLAALESRGLITGAEVGEVHRIHAEADAYDLKLERDRLRGRVVDVAANGTPPPFRDLLGLSQRSFRFRSNWNDDTFSTADGRINEVLLRSSTLLVSQNPRTGEYRIYRGDAFRTKVHELLHILHWTRSRSMPVGLNNDPRAFSWANYAHVEGVTTWGEDEIALKWLDDNYASLGMSTNDVRATKLDDLARSKNIRARLFYLTHAMSDPFGAARQTYIDTKNSFYRSSRNFPQEKLVDLLSMHTYDLGGPEVHALFNDIRESEEDRLGSRTAANAFVDEHFPLIARGVFTGAWSLAELRPWMFSHYLPRMRKAVGARATGALVSVPVALSEQPISEQPYEQPVLSP